MFKTASHQLAIALACAALALLAGCTPFEPLPTRVPTLGPIPTSPPDPTTLPTPTLIPTATPIPPAIVTIHWPEQVSALNPIPVEVELVPPPDVSFATEILVVVRTPQRRHYRTFKMIPGEGNLWGHSKSLLLPLTANGIWWVEAIVRSELDVEGEQQLAFRPMPVHFRDLAGVLPEGVDLRVPQDFVEVVTMGDRMAGGRVWRYEASEASPRGEASPHGEVSLWWAPGPHEPLLLNNAVVMLETTYSASIPEVASVEETTWQDQGAFLFHETWPGAEGGPGEALVIQGPDYWLYVLRVRALGSEPIPPLFQQVRDTLTFTTGE